MRELAELRRRVQALETVRRLPHSAVSTGAVRVTASGGVNVEDGGGAAVALDTLAFGLRVGFAAGQTITDLAAFGDGSSAGPVVPDVVVGTSGRCLVWMGARIGYSGVEVSQLGGSMSVRLDGPTQVEPSTLHSTRSAQSVTVVGATSWAHSGDDRTGAFHPFTGLAAGVYTITGQYQSANEGEDAFFTERIVVAIPY
jgi:hypothetical protein